MPPSDASVAQHPDEPPTAGGGGPTEDLADLYCQVFEENDVRGTSRAGAPLPSNGRDRLIPRRAPAQIDPLCLNTEGDVDVSDAAAVSYSPQGGGRQIGPAGHEDQDPAEYDSHPVQNPEDPHRPVETPNKTVFEGGYFGTRKLKLHQGRDVVVPTEDGDGWYVDDSGDYDASRHDERRRGHVEAVCQSVDLGQAKQDAVLGAIEDVECQRWASLGGRTATVAGVLLAWGDPRGRTLVEEELTRNEVDGRDYVATWWYDLKGRETREGALEAFCERLAEKARESEDVEL